MSERIEQLGGCLEIASSDHGTTGTTVRPVAACVGRRLMSLISVKTIDAHPRANIMRKLHFRSVSDLVRYAIRNRIVQP